MVLRDYQEETVRKAVEKIDSGKKLRIELSTGLGRMGIIARIAHNYANKRKKVLVLSPNKSICIQLENLVAEEKSLRTSDQAEYFEPTITTFVNDQMQNDINDFYLIICDGVSFGDLGQKIRNNSNLCVLGFTSQVRKHIKGYFSDSECIFSLSLQDVLDRYDTSGFDFEKTVYDIYSKRGYAVSGIEGNTVFDFSADKDSEHLIIAVKYWSSKKIANSTLEKIIEELRLGRTLSDNRKVTLVTNSVVDKEQRKGICKDDICIVDSSDLLAFSRQIKDKNIENNLKRILPFAIDEINTKFVSTNIPESTEKLDDLIKKYEEWMPDGTTSQSKKYEELCTEALKQLFENELTLWKEQQRSNDGVFRFDLICKIKSYSEEREFQKEFWRIAEKYFNTKYIVFEFKNYKKQIKQAEIFTTEKYLYGIALRKIAILISVCGADENAKKAIRGSLREQGKLIMSLDNQDMINMLKMKKKNKDVTGYLSGKLDEILVELEK